MSRFCYLDGVNNFQESAPRPNDREDCVSGPMSRHPLRLKIGFSKGHSKTSYLQNTLMSAAVDASKVSLSSDAAVTFSFGNIAHTYGATILPPLGQIEVSKTQDSSSGNLFRAA
jgi:hypothetical protein